MDKHTWIKSKSKGYLLCWFYLLNVELWSFVINCHYLPDLCISGNLCASKMIVIMLFSCILILIYLPFAGACGQVVICSQLILCGK